MRISTVGARWRSSSPYLLSVLRIVVAFLFTLHGTGKLFAFPAPALPDGMTLSLTSQTGLAALLETFGGVLMLVGLFTRPVAFLLSGQMAFAYFIAHAPKGFWPVLNGGEPAVFYCFTWLYFSAAGAGPWSLDALLRRRHTSPSRADGTIAQHRPRSAA